MSVEITRLENGLTVASDPMAHLESAAVGVWVNCGARHETRLQMGLSHMLEHMAFKGTATRSAKDIATQIEAVGGDLNAYTGREQTAFHARVLKADVPLALSLLADILLNSSFDAAELEREREVIVQEIGQVKDTPDDMIFDHLQSACYPDQPMGWPILGDEERVLAFKPGDLRTYMNANYRTEGMMVLGAGAVNHTELVDCVHKLFAELKPGSTPKAAPARFKGAEVRDQQKLEQVHLAFAFESVPMSHDDAITAHVFTTALGGGMSSRLFQEVREKRGLAYAISAFAHAYGDTGTFGIYAGTGADKAGEVAPIIAAEIEAMASGATEEETARARSQLKASILMGMESPQARCEHMASNLFAFGRVLDQVELTARVNAVDAAALRRYATKICANGGPALAAIGPIKRLELRDTFARRFGAASLSGAA